MKRGAGAFLVCLALALLHTWPLAKAPGSLSLNWNADAELNEWTFSWIAHALVHDPAHLIDGDIFAPERHTLTYTDPLLVPALAGAPLNWLGASPVLTFNLVQIAALAFTAWAGWLVVWKWTGSNGAALVAGALTGFNVHLLTRLPHAAAPAWGVPLAIYFADRVATTPGRRDAAWLAAIVAATAATSIYALTFVGLIIGIFIIVNLGRWRGIATVTAAAAVGLAVAAPVLWPYATLAASGVARPLSNVAQFSATPLGYLTSVSRLDGWWSRPFLQDEVNVFFAGFAALALAAIGAAAAGRAPADRRRLVALAAIAAAGVVLSFGPATGVYRALYTWFSPLRGLRAAARFGYLYLVVVAILAGLGVAAVEARARSRAARAAIVLGALVAVTAEAWSAPVRTTPFHGVPPIYRMLAAARGPVLLVELPFYPPEAVSQNGDYELAATAHWQPLANGASGLTPDSYRRRAASFWFFPRDWAIDAIEREGATHLMVHLDRFTPTEVADIQASLRHRPELRLVASDSYGDRLYEVHAPAK